MEDHLKNKDRLDREWEGLLSYEADPCTTAAALLPKNKSRNRYIDILPYDHSRVILNDLSNCSKSDYINANTIVSLTYSHICFSLFCEVVAVWVREEGAAVTILHFRVCRQIPTVFCRLPPAGNPTNGPEITGDFPPSVIRAKCSKMRDKVDGRRQAVGERNAHTASMQRETRPADKTSRQIALLLSMIENKAQRKGDAMSPDHLSVPPRNQMRNTRM